MCARRFSSSQPYRVSAWARMPVLRCAIRGSFLTMDIRLRLILLFAASVPLMQPQEYRATVSGNVTDPGGSSVPAARVTAINNQTTVAASAVTGPNGAFQIPFLLPGVYTLRVEHDGFKTMERGPLELHVNDNVRIDVELKVGQLAEHVTVMAEAPLLEVTT